MPIWFLSMEHSILISIHQNKAFHVLGLFTVFLLLQNGGATQFNVGGSGNWAIPAADPNAIHYNQWAEMNRFQIGDSLLFNYPADKDSVLHVTVEDYTNCNTATFIEKFSDGHTVYTFSQSGPIYFVSGVEENCLKNEKLMIIVMADRSNQSSGYNNSSPPPPGYIDIVPSPAPAGEGSPPPPSSGTVAIVPSAPPTSDQSPPPPAKNGAASIFVGLFGSFGAFIGSCLLLVF